MKKEGKKWDSVDINLQAVKSMGIDFDKVNLMEINDEVENSTFPGRECLRNCVEGGEVDIVIGVDNAGILPRFMGILPSGVNVYQSLFPDDVGSKTVYCGKHDSFMQLGINLHHLVVRNNETSKMIEEKGKRRSQLLQKDFFISDWK